ncbi:flagellar brake protein [Chitinibacteraceae bacterium HSL-7]
MLQAVVATDLKLNSPLPFSVYDGKARLLAKAGQVIADPAQLETLQRIGMRYPANWLSRPAPSAAPQRAPSRNKMQVGASAGTSSKAAPTIETPPSASAAPATAQAATSFSHYKLTPGTLVQIDSTNGRPRDTVRLVGWVERQGLILSTLNSQGTMLPFREGETLQIKTMAARDVLAFKVNVSKVFFSPFSAIYTSWPDKLDIKRLRQSMRVETSLICSAILPEGSKESARIINLSTHGCLLACATALPNWINELHLSFRLPAGGQEHVLRLRTQLRNRHFDDTTWCYGLEFDTPTMAEQLLLENYVLGCLLNH